MTADEAAVPLVKPMPMGYITYVHPPEVLPVPLPKVQTTWPGKGDSRAQGYGLVYGGGLFLLMLVVSVIYGLIGVLF